MTRSRASAKAAGSRFERDIADHLAANLDDRIDRMARRGAKDRGDIGGLRHMGQRITIEAKNTARPALGPWMEEAEIERRHDDAAAAIVIHKRHGIADPGRQFVTLTVNNLIAILKGEPVDPT